MQMDMNSEYIKQKHPIASITNQRHYVTCTTQNSTSDPPREREGSYMDEEDYKEMSTLRETTCEKKEEEMVKA